MAEPSVDAILGEHPLFQFPLLHDYKENLHICFYGLPRNSSSFFSGLFKPGTNLTKKTYLYKGLWGSSGKQSRLDIIQEFGKPGIQGLGKYDAVWACYSNSTEVPSQVLTADAILWSRASGWFNELFGNSTTLIEALASHGALPSIASCMLQLCLDSSKNNTDPNQQSILHLRRDAVTNTGEPVLQEYKLTCKAGTAIQLDIIPNNATSSFQFNTIRYNSAWFYLENRSDKIEVRTFTAPDVELSKEVLSRSSLSGTYGGFVPQKLLQCVYEDTSTSSVRVRTYLRKIPGYTNNAAFPIQPTRWIDDRRVANYLILAFGTPTLQQATQMHDALPKTQRWWWTWRGLVIDTDLDLNSANALQVLPRFMPFNICPDHVSDPSIRLNVAANESLLEDASQRPTHVLPTGLVKNWTRLVSSVEDKSGKLFNPAEDLVKADIELVAPADDSKNLTKSSWIEALPESRRQNQRTKLASAPADVPLLYLFEDGSFVISTILAELDSIADDPATTGLFDTKWEWLIAYWRWTRIADKAVGAVYSGAPDALVPPDKVKPSTPLDAKRKKSTNPGQTVGSQATPLGAKERVVGKPKPSSSVTQNQLRVDAPVPLTPTTSLVDLAKDAVSKTASAKVVPIPPSKVTLVGDPPNIAPAAALPPLAPGAAPPKAAPAAPRPAVPVAAPPPLAPVAAPPKAAPAAPPPVVPVAVTQQAAPVAAPPPAVSVAAPTKVAAAAQLPAVPVAAPTTIAPAAQLPEIPVAAPQQAAPVTAAPNVSAVQPVSPVSTVTPPQPPILPSGTTASGVGTSSSDTLVSVAKLREATERLTQLQAENGRLIARIAELEQPNPSYGMANPEYDQKPRQQLVNELTELRQQLKEQISKYEKLEQQSSPFFNKTQQENNRLQNEVNKLVADLDKQQADFDAELREKDDEYSKLKSQFDTLLSDYKVQTQQYKELEGRFETGKQQYEELRSQLLVLQQTNEKLELESNEAKRQYEARMRQLTSTNEQLQSLNKQQQKQIQELEANQTASPSESVDTLTNAINAMKLSSASSSGSVMSIDEEVTATPVPQGLAAIDALKPDPGDLSAPTNDGQANRPNPGSAGGNGQPAAIDVDQIRLANTMKNLEDELRRSQVELDNLRAQVAAYAQQEVDRLQREAQAVAAPQSAAPVDKAAQPELATLQKQLKDKEAQIETLTKELATANEDLIKQKGAAATNQVQVEALVKQLKQAKKIADTLRTDALKLNTDQKFDVLLATVEKLLQALGVDQIGQNAPVPVPLPDAMEVDKISPVYAFICQSTWCLEIIKYVCDQISQVKLPVASLTQWANEIEAWVRPLEVAPFKTAVTKLCLARVPVLVTYLELQGANATETIRSLTLDEVAMFTETRDILLTYAINAPQTLTLVDSGNLQKIAQRLTETVNSISRRVSSEDIIPRPPTTFRVDKASLAQQPGQLLDFLIGAVEVAYEWVRLPAEKQAFESVPQNGLWKLIVDLTFRSNCDGWISNPGNNWRSVLTTDIDEAATAFAESYAKETTKLSQISKDAETAKTSEANKNNQWVANTASMLKLTETAFKDADISSDSTLFALFSKVPFARFAVGLIFIETLFKNNNNAPGFLLPAWAAAYNTFKLYQ